MSAVAGARFRGAHSSVSRHESPRVLQPDSRHKSEALFQTQLLGCGTKNAPRASRPDTSARHPVPLRITAERFLLNLALFGQMSGRTARTGPTACGLKTSRAQKECEVPLQGR